MLGVSQRVRHTACALPAGDTSHRDARKLFPLFPHGRGGDWARQHEPRCHQRCPAEPLPGAPGKLEPQQLAHLLFWQVQRELGQGEGAAAPEAGLAAGSPGWSLLVSHTQRSCLSCSRLRVPSSPRAASRPACLSALGKIRSPSRPLPPLLPLSHVLREDGTLFVLHPTDFSISPHFPPPPSSRLWLRGGASQCADGQSCPSACPPLPRPPGSFHPLILPARLPPALLSAPF